MSDIIGGLIAGLACGGVIGYGLGFAIALLRLGRARMGNRHVNFRP